MTVSLAVAKREASAKSVREDNKLPAVIYGPKQEPIIVQMDRVAFEKTLEAAGESTIITLEGLESPIEVLIHEVAFNAARGGVEHVDFYAIERGKELTTNVALEFIGEAPIESTGAMVNKILHEVEVTCKPSKLPSHIDVNMSTLTDVDAQITVADLVVPEGVIINTEGDTIVATVAGAREEEPEEPDVTEIDMDAIEVEKKGKGEVAEEV